MVLGPAKPAFAHNYTVITPRDHPWVVLDVQGNSTAAGAPLQIWGYNGTSAQFFVMRLIRYEGGYPLYMFRGLGSNNCIDVPGGQGGNGTKLQMWPCNYTNAQLFWVPFQSGSNYVFRSNINFGDGFSGGCMDVPNGSTAWGTRMQLWSCYWNMSNPNQVFTYSG
jgi:hypothetical protein